MLDALVPFFPLFRLLAVFGLMLVCVRLRLGLGLAVLLGSLVLGLWFDMGFLRWLAAGAGIFKDQSTLLVWLVLSLILALSSLMEKTGQAERFMKALSHHIISPRVRLVFFPILIGLLPMPGGAVFSAPLIQAVARGMAVPELDKSLINYWFRHTAEMTWPLFPAIILAAGISRVATPELVLHTCLLAPVFFAAGWFSLVRGLNFPPSAGQVDPEISGSWSNVLRQGLPLGISLGGAILLEILIAFLLPGLPVDYGVPVALIVGVTVCLAQNGLTGVDLARAVLQRHVIGMIFIVGALGVFRIILEESGVVEALMHMGGRNTALWLAAVGLPLLVGLVTGLLMACVGVTLPLIMALAPAGDPVLSWVVLSLISGFTGTMISPLHICFVLSCRYFNVDMASSWRRLPKPCLFFALAGAVYAFLLRWSW